mgnify:CR=1 FL=1|jgi:hypothetical protein
MANIELDGANKKIKVDSGDLTFDVPGDIILDADGADLVFADGGTNILKITNSSSDVVLQPQVDAKDIIFKQYDGTEVAKIDDDGSFKVANSTLGISQSSSDVIIKPLTDAKDIIFQQYDGTAVATVEDNGTLNIPASKLAIGGTAVTSTAAELNILDGVTATAAEINLIDGGTARGTTAIADGDGVLINDAGTMRQTTVETLKTYIGGAGLVQTGRTIISSDTAGIYLDDIFSTTYTNYIVLIRNMTPVSDEDDFRFRVNVSGTQKSTSEYIYMTEFLDTGGGSQGHESSASDTEIKLAHDVDNESWKGGYNAIMHVSTHLSDASNRAAFVMSGTASYIGDSGIGYVSHFGGNYADSDRAAVTGLDFYYNSGSIARGEITCYGVTIV